MSALLETARAQTRDLPSDEKLLLRVELIDAARLGEKAEEPAESVTHAWSEEITRRVEDIRSGKVKPVPWEDVLARTERTIRMGSVTLHPDAQQEFDDTIAFYEGARKDLGREFRDEVMRFVNGSLRIPITTLSDNLMCAVPTLTGSHTT